MSVENKAREVEYVEVDHSGLTRDDLVGVVEDAARELKEQEERQRSFGDSLMPYFPPNGRYVMRIWPHRDPRSIDEKTGKARWRFFRTLYWHKLPEEVTKRRVISDARVEKLVQEYIDLGVEEAKLYQPKKNILMMARLFKAEGEWSTEEKKYLPITAANPTPDVPLGLTNKMHTAINMFLVRLKVNEKLELLDPSHKAVGIEMVVRGKGDSQGTVACDRTFEEYDMGKIKLPKNFKFDVSILDRVWIPEENAITEEELAKLKAYLGKKYVESQTSGSVKYVDPLPTRGKIESASAPTNGTAQPNGTETKQCILADWVKQKPEMLSDPRLEGQTVFGFGKQPTRLHPKCYICNIPKECAEETKKNKGLSQ